MCVAVATMIVSKAINNGITERGARANSVPDTRCFGGESPVPYWSSSMDRQDESPSLCISPSDSSLALTHLTRDNVISSVYMIEPDTLGVPRGRALTN